MTFIFLAGNKLFAFRAALRHAGAALPAATRTHFERSQRSLMKAARTGGQAVRGKLPPARSKHLAFEVCCSCMVPEANHACILRSHVKPI